MRNRVDRIKLEQKPKSNNKQQQQQSTQTQKHTRVIIMPIANNRNDGKRNEICRLRLPRLYDVDATPIGKTIANGKKKLLMLVLVAASNQKK